MSAWIGWGLALAALAVGWLNWGWQGVALAVTVIVFWLILQFNRAVRLMRHASGRPVGHVDSAVMLNAKLHAGMALWQVVTMTRSLGKPVEGVEETFCWEDPGGSSVTLKLKRGKVAEWKLDRPQEPVDPAA